MSCRSFYKSVSLLRDENMQQRESSFICNSKALGLSVAAETSSKKALEAPTESPCAGTLTQTKLWSIKKIEKL